MDDAHPAAAGRRGRPHEAEGKRGGAVAALLMFALLGCLFCALSISCGGGEGGGGCQVTREDEAAAPVAREPGKLLAVCTTTLLADLVRQVGGPDVQAVSLMDYTDDPHQYRLARGERDLLKEADLIFANGLGLEAGMEEDLSKAGRERTLVKVGDAIHPTFLRRPPGTPTQYDPHIWMDLFTWAKATSVVRAALSEADSVHAPDYHDRTEVYLGELSDLSNWTVAIVKEIPAEKRTIVTFHDAFGYFRHSLRTETFSLLGITTAATYTGEDVERLARELDRRDVGVIFAEAGAPQEPWEGLQQAARERGHELRVGGTLFTDALGEPGTPADNFLGMFRYNINTYAEGVK